MDVLAKLPQDSEPVQSGRRSVQTAALGPCDGGKPCFAMSAVAKVHPGADEHISTARAEAPDSYTSCCCCVVVSLYRSC